jgi:hypothetical protein
MSSESYRHDAVEPAIGQLGYVLSSALVVQAIQLVPGKRDHQHAVVDSEQAVRSCQILGLATAFTVLLSIS